MAATLHEYEMIPCAPEFEGYMNRIKDMTRKLEACTNAVKEAQNQASLLDENLTVFQTIDDVAKGEIRN